MNIRRLAESFPGDDFSAFCSERLVIQDKQGDIVPLKLNRAQLELDGSLTGRDIVLKARQLGVSTCIQARMFYDQMEGGARTSTLCHEDELTSTLRRMVDRFYNELPEAHRYTRKYANAKLTTYGDDLNSEGSIATVGGQAGGRKGRGGSLTRIHGSEVAYWPDAEGVMSAAMQAGNPDIVLESTANGMSGWFYERCMEALDGDSIWTLHFFPWWYDDDYRLAGEPITFTPEEQILADAHGLDADQIRWRRLKIKELPHTFKQEYPEDPYSCFLASGKSYFGDVEHVFTAPMVAIYYPGRRYVAGLDFAQTGDYTVLIVFDTSTRQMVDMLHINQLSWQEMRRQISVMANKWNAVVYGEANSMGTTNIELLQTGEILEDGTRIRPINLIPWDSTPASKPPLIQGLHVALHEIGIELWSHSVLKHELRAFISKQTIHGHWQYMGSDGAHDDTVIALALAWHGANNAPLFDAELYMAPQETYGIGPY